MKTSNPIRRRYQKDNPILVLDGQKDVISGESLTCQIAGTRYGIVDGVVTSFDANDPPIEDYGLRACPAFTQYFLNNEIPETQTITLPAGNYTMWCSGSGSVEYDGNIATEGSPSFFTSTGTTLSATVTGDVDNVMLTSGSFIAPFTPTEGSVVDVVSEIGLESNGTRMDFVDDDFISIKNILRGFAI